VGPGTKVTGNPTSTQNSDFHLSQPRFRQGFLVQSSESRSCLQQIDLRLRIRTMRRSLVSASLRLGICIPFMYFGTQLLAVPFYPGFNILVNSASDLGTAHSWKPWIFNLGAIATGLITFASVYGFYQSLRSSGTNFLLTALVCLSLMCYGTSSLAAGVFPMPHPYHGAGPVQFGIILGPVLFVAAFWKRRRGSGWVFWCLAACLALFAVALVLMRPGVTGINTDPIMGLLQRILAVAGFAPLGLAAYDLLKQQMQGIRLSLDFPKSAES
jgi:hypothetical membrane protein